MASFGYDTNQPGASDQSRGSVQIPDAYFTGIVEDIITNNSHGKFLKYKPDGSNIGEAKIRIIPNDWNTPVESLNEAYPLETNIQNYPLVGEVVILFKVLRTMFYTRPLGNRSRITDNLVKSIASNFTELPDRQIDIDTRNLALAGVSLDQTNVEKSSFFTYSRNYDVRPLSSSTGDMIFQGRFSNTIRLGSSLLFNPAGPIPKPNILLTAGLDSTPRSLSTSEITPFSLTQENINRDRSSIWMISDEPVQFVPVTAQKNAVSHILSSPNKTNEYLGAQIFINSDRVILNSKQKEISLFSGTEINLSAMEAITIDTDEDIFLRSFGDININASGPSGSVFIKGSEITMIASKNLTYKTTGDYGISGKRIFIGKYGDTTQPMVLGTQLAAFLTSLTTNVTQLTTVVSTLVTGIKTLGTAGAYVGTATPAGVVTVTPAAAIAVASAMDGVTGALSTVTSQLGALVAGSNPKGASFNSTDNFVSKANV